MACRSCGLGLDTSTSHDEGLNPDPWQTTNYLNRFGDPTPASHIPADHQRLDANDLFRNDTWSENFSTMAGPEWPAPTPTLENTSFSIHHDGTEPWASMPTSSLGGVLCRERRPVDTKEQKEPLRTAERAPALNRGNECRVKEQTSYSNQRSSRRSDAHHDLKCRWSGCGRRDPFCSKGTLMRHIETQHVNTWSFQCPEQACGRYFKRKDKRDAHIRNVHRK